MPQGTYSAKCSCWCESTDYADHKPSCALMVVPDFEDGYAYWDADRYELVEIDEDTRDLLNGDANLDPRELTALYPPSDPKPWWEQAWGDLDKHEDKKPITGYVTGATAWAGKCSHTQDEVILPDGTIVYASSSHARGTDEMVPDLGIYLDGCWKPDCRAYHVGCPDYSIPRPSVAVVLSIAREGVRMAQAGLRVEVGCIGGHGRTGLMLAVMSLVVVHDKGGTMAGDKATAYVRAMHCDHAIESREQEWYIRGIGCELRGEVWPAKPIPPVVKKTSVTVKNAVKATECKACGHWTNHSKLNPCKAHCKNAEGKWAPCLCAVGNEGKPVAMPVVVAAPIPTDVIMCWCGKKRGHQDGHGKAIKINNQRNGKRGSRR